MWSSAIFAMAERDAGAETLGGGPRGEVADVVIPVRAGEQTVLMPSGQAIEGVMLEDLGSWTARYRAVDALVKVEALVVREFQVLKNAPVAAHAGRPGDGRGASQTGLVVEGSVGHDAVAV